MIEYAAMRLECQAGGGLDNQTPNHSGQDGTAGWTTPTVGTSLTATGAGLVFASSGAVDPFPWTVGQPILSDPVLIAAGEYAAASWEVPVCYDQNGPATYRHTVDFLRADLTVISSAPAVTTTAAPGVDKTSTPTAAPAGVVYVRARLDPLSYPGSWPGANASYRMTFRRHVLAIAPTAGDLVDLQDHREVNWVDVLGPSRNIKISRRPLDLSTLTAAILDPALDPGIAQTLRPGRRCRFQLATADGWATLFSGKTKVLDVDLNPYVITLVAYDPLTPLQNTPRAEGVETVEDLRYVMEGTGVPAYLNGDSSQPAGTPTITAVNDNANAVDQIAIVRDTVAGYAWIDRNGALQVNDPAHMPTDPVAVLDETVYGPKFSATFKTSRIINSVKVNVETEESGETVIKTFGPYEDLASVREWERCQKTFTVHSSLTGTPLEDAIEAYATALLAANATPQRVPSSAVIPINRMRVPFYDGGSFEATGSDEIDGGAFTTPGYTDEIDGGSL